MGDVNRVLTPQEWNVDNTYWGGQDYEGYAMLNRLLGTLDPAPAVGRTTG